jgi:hypothetical protein
MLIDLKQTRVGISEKLFHSLSILYLAFFFPIIAVVNYFFNAENNMISLGYRVTALVIGLIIIFRQVFLGKMSAQLHFWVILFFWIFYFTHYFIDLFVYNLYLFPENGQFYYFSQGFLVTFLNFIVIYIAAQKIDKDEFIRTLMGGVIFINILVFVLIIIKSNFDFQSLLKSRFEIESTDTGNKYLNPITISTYASFGIIMIRTSEINYVIRKMLFLVFGFNIIFSASMSPTLGLVLVLLLNWGIGFYKNVKTGIYPLLIVVFLCGLVISYINLDDFLILQRVIEGGEGQSSIERRSFISSSIEQIKDNFFWGTHYFTISDHSSPHNIFIDIVLSTGVFGLCIFLYPLFVFLKYTVVNFKRNVICQMALLIFFIVQFSGYVFGASDFFALMAILFAFKQKEVQLT